MHGQGYGRHRNVSGEGLWRGCEKGGLRSGDPACHCSHRAGPLSPSCLRVPGLTLETQFGFPVCPAGDHRHTSCPITPPPTSPGPEAPASWRVMAVSMSTYTELHGYSGAAGAKSLGQAGEARDGRCVRLWQYLRERAECSRAGQAVSGRGPAHARGAMAVPAACPHSTPPTMAPLFPVARQFGGGSSVTHTPLNRGQINPLGDFGPGEGSQEATWLRLFPSLL